MLRITENSIGILNLYVGGQKRPLDSLIFFQNIETTRGSVEGVRRIVVRARLQYIGEVGKCTSC